MPPKLTPCTQVQLANGCHTASNTCYSNETGGYLCDNAAQMNCMHAPRSSEQVAAKKACTSSSDSQCIPNYCYDNYHQQK